MPHAIPPGPYCPPYDPKTREVGSPVIIGTEFHADVLMDCHDHGISTDVLVPRLVMHLVITASCSNLNPAERSRCWELARLVLAEASERMRAEREG